MLTKPVFRAIRPAVLFAAGVLAGALAGALCQTASADSPKGNTSISEDIYKKLFGKRRSSEADQKRARANTAIMGIRGLDDDADAPLKAGATANLRAVYEMEDRAPNEGMIENLRAEIQKNIPAETAKNLPVRIQNAAPTTDELEGEIDLGRKMAAQVLGANRTYDNPKVLSYMAALTKIVADSGLTSTRPFRIAVLQSDKVNAFACPGGYIFVTKGALKSTRTESQLAALLGHEIVHVSNRHLVSSLKRKITKKDDSGSDKKNSDPHSLARQRVKPKTSGESTAWEQMLGPKGVGLTLLQASSEALDTLLSKGLEKEFELEADRLGQQISAAAGYESRSLLDLLNQMKTQKTIASNTTASTHPPYDIRIANIRQYVDTLAGQSNATSIGSKLYTEMQREWSRE